MAAGIPMLKKADGKEVPYFLWDRTYSDDELRAILADPDNPERIAMMRVILREARPGEVWSYMTPDTVLREWPKLEPGLGRKREFWKWLIGAWRDRGFFQ